MQKRFLVIGAHPDDPDLMFGGTALKLIKAGHAVKFVSVTNGCAGHHILSEKELIKKIETYFFAADDFFYFQKSFQKSMRRPCLII